MKREIPWGRSDSDGSSGPEGSEESEGAVDGASGPKVVPPLAAGCVEGLCRKVLKMEVGLWIVLAGNEL